MSFLITTTGTASTITFDDLGGRTISHPTVDLDFDLEFTSEELREKTCKLISTSDETK